MPYVDGLLGPQWLSDKPSLNTNLRAQALRLGNAPQSVLMGAPRLPWAAPPAPAPNVKAMISALSLTPGIGDAIGVASDAVDYLRDPGSRTPLNFGLTALGALPFVPSGLKGLDMSAAARHLRAKEQGYRPVIHGTSTTSDFTKGIDQARFGASTGGDLAKLGVSVVDPSMTPNAREIAERYAVGAAKSGGGLPKIQDFMLRIARDMKGGTVDVGALGKDVSSISLAADIADAKAEGLQYVVLKNFPHPGGLVGDFVLVLDPGILRLPEAGFDPKALGKPEILAGMSATAVAPGIYLVDPFEGKDRAGEI